MRSSVVSRCRIGPPDPRSFFDRGGPFGLTDIPGSSGYGPRIAALGLLGNGTSHTGLREGDRTNGFGARRSETKTGYRCAKRERTSRSRQSSARVSAPYRAAISIGSGSTRCQHALHRAISRTRAVAALPGVIGGPGCDS